MMSKVRSKDSKAELALRRELWARGRRYRLHRKDVVGTPDLVFVRHGLAVFVDSDFWHARSLVEGDKEAFRQMVRGRRQDWWIAKLSRNAERDREVTADLEADGWAVLRIWESGVLDNPVAAADRVESALEDLEK